MMEGGSSIGASSGTLPVGESMTGVESTATTEVILTQAQATALIMEVVRYGGKVEVERHGLWREVAATVGLPYHSDADVERLLTQASTLRGAAGPTWEERERERQKPKKEPTALVAAVTAPPAAALPTPVPIPVAVAESISNESGGEQPAARVEAPASVVTTEATDGTEPASRNAVVATPAAETTTAPVALAVVPTETIDGGGQTSKTTAKGKEKGNNKTDTAAAAEAEAEEAGGNNAKEKKRKKKKKDGKGAESAEPEEKGDVFTVEKIVGKRKRRGKVEYLIKWEGYPEASNTWEKQEDVFCTELIQAFEADLQARSAKRKRKSTGDAKPTTAGGETEKPQTTSASSVSTADDDELLNQPNTDGMDLQDTSEGIGSPKAKRPRTSTASDTKTTTEATEAKVGFDFGDELENILGIQRSKDGFLCAYVSWLGKDDCSYVPTQLIALKSPQKLIAFYESHIQFDTRQ